MVDMQKAQAEIAQITEIIKQTVPAERIYLFGSYAYGQPNEHSDYDFYVVIPDDSMRTREATQSIHWAVAQSPLMMPIDVLASHINRFDARKQLNSLERKINRDGRLLYERA
ncbi:MAG: nucleotidyltransferase domain-containing protein [Oscillospiraceae bacterium]|nr:nucleotidyltransferase domain-containing protein [Oscillospiraceae bacterium]